ncbi:hypothetical protein NONI108955_06285 [Nocardia ninae]|uniref:Uncharacterized protein n=1 Tax=Nocardia ninae NBRC 108245 TaxID=1210091 RepID=A0A511MJV5_9NOCA|nr:hypothetical protein [Nocardia ninae]GEM40922.1 hypothetical protein NN4_54410 [Nocardia ninae NBRC 108245]
MDTDNAAAELRRLDTSGLLALFTTLEAPTIAEIDGEYTATMLAQPNLFAVVTAKVALANPLGPWLCKAFRPVDENGGRGYNTFGAFGRVRQRHPMRTLLAPSRYDGAPAYTLIYRAYTSVCGSIHMVDEVRRAAPGVYLGMGTWGFTDAQRRVARPFLLTGPVGPYRGDIGRARPAFTPGPRELPGLPA